MNPLLFVYGTLMTTTGHPSSKKLMDESKLLGSGTVQGKLYRIDWYPAVLESSNPSDLVHGQILQMSDPVSSLRWLDEYENGADPEFLREERIVLNEAGEEVLCWIYLYNRPCTESQRIPSGRWT